MEKKNQTGVHSQCLSKILFMTRFNITNGYATQTKPKKKPTWFVYTNFQHFTSNITKRARI